MPLDSLLLERLQELEHDALLRDPSDPLRHRAVEAARNLGLPLLDASSNDYLGLAQLPVSRETSGAGASRLLNGSRTPHTELERALASWLGTESALLFSSGYAANVGVLAALVTRVGTVLSDALNHASIIDGCRLSRGNVVILPHGDSRALETALHDAPRGAWVVCESYFSMDGTSPDLATIRELCTRYEAYLVVDEAHALGALGPQGKGLCAAAGVRPDVLIGTFGKAFGVHGAFVAGSATLRRYLWNTARSFVFSTATSPALAATVLDRLPLVAAADEERSRLGSLCDRFEEEVRRLGLQMPAARHGPIFALIVGTAEAAVELADRLADEGILAPAIRAPTVPPDTSRIRLTLKATMTHADLDRVLAALERAAGVVT